jgi:hypothetical protein
LLIHLALYDAVLFWIAGTLARMIERRVGDHAWCATLGELVLLAGIRAMRIFGIARGQIRWLNAYQIYASPDLR